MPSTTPHKIDEPVRAFAKSISTGSLSYVEVSPASSALRGECFSNVRRCVDHFGGGQLFGWMIWIWPGVYIEAEHHSVWRKADGSICDPTPPFDGEERILFLEDDMASYDFDARQKRDNIRVSLRRDPLITKYLQAGAQTQAYIAAHSNGNVITMPQHEWDAICDHNHALLVELRRRYLRQNDPCTCRSGRKVKKCCGMAVAIEYKPQRARQ